MLQIGLTACILIGACLLGFVRAWADPQGIRTRHDRYLLLLLLVLAIGFGVAFPYSDNLQLWTRVVLSLIHLGWFLCILVSAWVFYRRIKQRVPVEANPTLTNKQVGSVIASVAVIWLAYKTTGLTSYIVGALSFSVVLYLSIIVMLAQRARASQKVEVNVAAVSEPYQNRKIDSGEAEADLQSLHKIMADEELYKSASLTLPKLARRLNLPTARLSQLLNDNHKTTFKQYLAQLRIDAAKKLLLVAAPQSMEQIAEASGFLSMSTFYNSFKKLEGATPTAWRDAQLLQRPLSKE